MDLWTVGLTVVVVFLILIYYHLAKNHGYWESRGVKEKEPVLLFGSIQDRVLLKKSFHEFYTDLYFETEGYPYAGYYEGRIPALIVRDPELIRSVLSKDFDHFSDRNLNIFHSTPYIGKMMILLTGPEWKHVRSSVTPTFSTGRIKGMFGMVEECAEALTAYVDKLIVNNDGKTTGDIDIKETFSKFTLDVIASTAFGVNCNSFQEGQSEFASVIAKFNDITLVNRMFILAMILLDIPQWIKNLLPLTFFNMKTIDFLARVVKDTTQHRKENNIRRNDFLQLLMDAQTKPVERNECEKENDNVELISEDVAIAQSLIFFIAGFETSGTLLTMTCYELAQNLDVQDRLRDEIIQKSQLCGGKVTYEELNDLPYLDMVIAESLRMHPPLARLDRICTKPVKLGEIDLEVKTKIIIPVSGLHNDPKYFPEPKVFRPERFSQEEKAKRHAYAYLPFGQGPRNCIGMRFAQMSVKLCLVHVIKNFIISICPKTQIPFEFNRRSMVLKSESGVYLQLMPYKN